MPPLLILGLVFWLLVCFFRNCVQFAFFMLHFCCCLVIWAPCNSIALYYSINNNFRTHYGLVTSSSSPSWFSFLFPLIVLLLFPFPILLQYSFLLSFSVSFLDGYFVRLFNFLLFCVFHNWVPLLNLHQDISYW